MSQYEQIGNFAKSYSGTAVLDSYDAVKNHLIACSNLSSDTNGIVFVTFYNNFTDANFTSKTYWSGILTKVNSSTYFIVGLNSLLGNFMTIGKSNQSWNIKSLMNE